MLDFQIVLSLVPVSLHHQRVVDLVQQPIKIGQQAEKAQHGAVVLREALVGVLLYCAELVGVEKLTHECERASVDTCLSVGFKFALTVTRWIAVGAESIA